MGWIVQHTRADVQRCRSAIEIGHRLFVHSAGGWHPGGCSSACRRQAAAQIPSMRCGGCADVVAACWRLMLRVLTKVGVACFGGWATWEAMYRPTASLCLGSDVASVLSADHCRGLPPALGQAPRRKNKAATKTSLHAFARGRNTINLSY